MDPIQTDLSPKALVDAIRGNMYAFLRFAGQRGSKEYFENETFARWFTSVPHPWFNGVLCNAPPATGDEAFLNETLAFFRERRVEAITWWLNNGLQRADWDDFLLERGFGFSDDTPGMAVDLSKLHESHTKPDGLDIRVVADEETLHAWTHVFIQGYGVPADWESAFFQLLSACGLELPMRNYLGYLDGEPLAASTLFLGAGAAGIYDVATLPPARGRGLGAAMTLTPLLEARQLGYRAGVLQSSDMGYNVYRKLGFERLCRIENYYRTLT